MTMPDERSRALVWAGGFLVELARDERLPLEIRQQSAKIARHFPTIEQISALAVTVQSSTTPFGIELDDPAKNPVWGTEFRHGPLTFRTRLEWPMASDDSD